MEEKQTRTEVYDKIGEFSAKVISTLSLDIKPGTPIYLSPSSREHILERHYDDYIQYALNISDIIANPEYVGLNPDNSVAFVKNVREHLVSADVRITCNGLYHFVRTMHSRQQKKFDKLVAKGKFFKISDI